jgi:colanic acid biosynthesis glycosyl transferase WcaI
MKIWIHTMYFLPEFGSAPILMDELATYLASRGHDVEVITTVPRPPHHKPYRGRIFTHERRNGYSIKRWRTNFTVHHIGRLVAWSIYTFFTMFNLFRVRRNDVLFLRLPPLQLGVTGILGKKWRKAKVLLNVQDIHPDLSIESGLLRNPQAIKQALKFEKWIYDHSENILVISQGFKDNLVGKGVPGKKVDIIPNWVDTGFLKPFPKDNPLARKYNLMDKFVIMYSGTISISSINTLENIMECASILKKNKKFVFVIVGEGLKKPELKAKAESLKLDNVLFLPFQPYEDLPALLGCSDVLLVPLDKEKSLLSVPSKLYNFMAAGRPIMGLAHKDSEVRALIEETGCGVCVSPEDIPAIAAALEDLEGNRERSSAMAENARKYAVEHYAKDQVLEGLDRLIKKL